MEREIDLLLTLWTECCPDGLNLDDRALDTWVRLLEQFSRRFPACTGESQ